MCPPCCWKTHSSRRRHWPMARSMKRISQGSVATHLRCGRIFSDSVIANFLLILTVKEFWIFDELKAYKKWCHFYWATLYYAFYTTCVTFFAACLVNRPIQLRCSIIFDSELWYCIFVIISGVDLVFWTGIMKKKSVHDAEGGSGSPPIIKVQSKWYNLRPIMSHRSWPKQQ